MHKKLQVCKDSQKMEATWESTLPKSSTPEVYKSVPQPPPPTDFQLLATFCASGPYSVIIKLAGYEICKVMF